MNLIKTGAIFSLGVVILGIIFLWVAIKLAAKSEKKKLRDTGQMSGNLVIAIVFAAVSVLLLGGAGLIYVMRDTISTYFTTG